MTLQFKVSAGVLTRGGTFVSTAYSGHSDGLNDPSHQSVPFIGPIPQGEYTIGPQEDHPKLGPIAMPLIPDPANQMFGRDAFFIHGDNALMNYTASDGCIIVPHEARLAISENPDRHLVVIP